MSEIATMQMIMNVPECSQFRSGASSKCLGWLLGLDRVNSSYQAPLTKNVHRVEEVVTGAAAAALAISRYNRRAVSVLSYFAQFTLPTQQIGLPALDHWAVHKILHMPPNSVSRERSHSLGGLTHIQPRALEFYCAACLCRFASSERSHPLSLQSKK
jgi:hypothetical protein